jgi:hypothetical protein
MPDPRHRPPNSDDPIETANELLRRSPNRTESPRAEGMEGAPGRAAGVESLEGQLGPDEISDPDEVVRNNEAKQQ